MIAQAPTTSASPASASGLPSAQTGPASGTTGPAASGTTAPASESRSVARSGRVFRLLSARRARPKAAGPTRTASRAEEAVPGTPDVWLAGLRLGG
ncbi:hypothetical protein [Streptomyces sp. NBC_00151]|uniref:hypothetical protein n=1 Tax=Streptomyces sp. NBC_00151 TaxID=2975669 RepID=UPI002DD8DA80|nr:hypothetical protein [Streptomyces sp. NBC_00151]WRZ43499.1 hypothetical protein OG915_38920 [Streptomyces sp. NBC_00151]